MQGANLMQSIARVNRVFNNAKEGGLIVDYIGLAQYIKEAMVEYTISGGQGKPTLDDELAVAKCLEFYEGIEHQLRFFDWKKFFTLKPEEKLRYIKVIQDYILSKENGSDDFTDTTAKLLKAYALVPSHERIDALKDNIALFQAIRARLVKFNEEHRVESGGKTNAEIDLAIKQIVSEALVSEDVVDIFDAAGIKKPNIGILDEAFLNEIKGMEQKNLAVELLKKLLRDELKQRAKFNLIQSKQFSEKLEEAINRYHTGQLDSVEFIEKWLIPLGNEIREADKRGKDLGLDFREYAFYTALEVNNSAVKILGDGILKHIAQELLKTVRNSTTIDWTIKESVQSALRRNIRRILRLHGYPPDLQEKAVETIITQAKMLAENLVAENS
jgi:type I restriction enzyme R subunit